MWLKSLSVEWEGDFRYVGDRSCTHGWPTNQQPSANAAAPKNLKLRTISVKRSECVANDGASWPHYTGVGAPGAMRWPHTIRYLKKRPGALHVSNSSVAVGLIFKWITRVLTLTALGYPKTNAGFFGPLGRNHISPSVNTNILIREKLL